MKYKYRVVRSVLCIIAMHISILGSAYAQDPNEEMRQASKLVVMIKGQLDGAETIGAGIIIGVGNDRLYIVTANHVVRRGTREAQDLKLNFRFLPGEQIEAILLEHQDIQFDIAVLCVVDLERNRIPVDALPFDRLGDSNVLEREDAVYHVGFPLGRPWKVNVKPDWVSEKGRGLIKFESNSIGAGNSGGGLFNARWELVGMIKADQPPDGVAVDIQNILEILRQWGYPVSLFSKQEKEFFTPKVTDLQDVPSDDESINALREAAEKGDAKAQYDLAQRLMMGAGVEQDCEQAVKWLRMSARKGYAAAQNELGVWYVKGYCVQPDETEGLRWVQKAAEQGHADGLYHLGVFYLNGTGVDTSDSEAAKWFLKAAKAGDETAQYSIGRMYVEGQGVKQSYAEAAKWYRKAADQGHVDAMGQLGAFYGLGIGVDEDLSEAKNWTQKAAEKNDANAQYNLGIFYRDGKGVRKDDVEAAKWFLKAANQHDVNAMTMLGTSYYNGEGVERDYVEAVKWLSKAADQGNADAQFNLGICYVRAHGVEEDFVKAMEWIRKAAKQGHEEANNALQQVFEN